jgi:polar amino acid transport system substrate-binding protein
VTRSYGRGKGLGLALFVALTALTLAGCGGGEDSSTGATTGAPADKLAQVMQRGTLVLFTDPQYPPQSEAVKGAARAANTTCAADQLTAPEITGYDAETGKAVAAAMGVEPCFVTPSWDDVIAGGWGDRWDVAWGSGAITADRMTRLYVTQPTYSTPTNIFVAKGSPVHHVSQLSGKSIGACAGCTMEQYLEGTLELPGVTLSMPFDHPEVVPFDNEIPGLHAVAKGNLDAFLCSEPVGAGEIKAGLPIRMLPETLYQTYKTGYLDQSSTLSSATLVDKINEIVGQLHADGTLKRLSMKAFGADYATAAGIFDYDSLDQQVQ